MKRFATLIAFLLCVCLAACAMADTGATLVRDGLADTDWVKGTDRLCVEGDPVSHSGSNYRAYSMTTLDGTQLTEAIYNSLKGDKGYVVAVSLKAEDLTNSSGLLDLDGNVLIPCEYGDIDVLSSEWAVGVKLLVSTAENYDYSSWFSDNKYLIDTVDVYHLPEGNKLVTLSRSDYNGARAINHCINIENRATSEVTTYDASFNALGTVSSLYRDEFAPADYETFYENRHYGRKAADGTVLVEPVYATIYSSSYQGMMRVKADNDKVGLITLQGDVVIPAEYDDVISGYYMPVVDGETSGYVAAGYVAVKIGDKLGYVDVNGNLVFESEYIADNMRVRGASATVDDAKTGGVIIIAADGVETTVNGYSSFYPLDYGSGVYYYGYGSDYAYTLVDWHGEVIIPGTNGNWTNRDISLSGDGKYALVESRDNNYNYNVALYELSYPEASEVAVANVAPAEEGEQAASNGNSAVTTLLENAVSLLSDDDTANDASVAALLSSAVTLLGDSNPAAVSLLESAVTLLGTDATANASSVLTLLDSAAAAL